MSEEEEERFEAWWKEFENTEGIVDFCNDQLKYVAKIAFHAGNLDHVSIKQAESERGIC
jgi:hypothetical protein